MSMDRNPWECLLPRLYHVEASSQTLLVQQETLRDPNYRLVHHPNHPLIRPIPALLPDYTANDNSTDSVAESHYSCLQASGSMKVYCTIVTNDSNDM